MTRRLLLAVLLLFAACSDDSSGSDATTTTTAPATTTTFAGATTPVSTPPKGSPVVVSAVRVGAHDSFDRVVFESASAVPGYSVKYVDKPIIADGSGDEIGVEGGAAIEVRLEPALAHDIGQHMAGAGVVKEVVKSGDFEAVVHFAIGVASKVAFRAYESEGKKLIVDIAHG